MEEINGTKPELVSQALKAGLHIDNVHLPYIHANLLWEDKADSEGLLRSYITYVKECGKYAIKTAVIHLTDGEKPPPANEKGLNRMKRLCEAAEKNNVILAAENLQVSEHLGYVLSNINSQSLGFCYDSGHENCHHPYIDNLKLYGDRLKAVHLHDNDGKKDQHLIPGEGSIDWRATIAKINASGYKGTFMLEVAKADSENIPTELFLQKAYQRITQLAHINKI